MELVVDTNVLFSFFKADSSTRKLIIDYKPMLFAPEETIKELTKYTDIICIKAYITRKEFRQILRTLSTYIEMIPRSKFLKSYHEAQAILLPSSQEDAPFIGLALHLDIPLWSNDKALKKQDKVKVISTAELLKIVYYQE